MTQQNDKAQVQVEMGAKGVCCDTCEHYANCEGQCAPETSEEKATWAAYIARLAAKDADFQALCVKDRLTCGSTVCMACYEMTHYQQPLSEYLPETGDEVCCFDCLACQAFTSTTAANCGSRYLHDPAPYSEGSYSNPKYDI